MATLNEYYPQEVLHPCETLNEKLEEIGMSRKEFALRTGKPEKTIIAVLPLVIVESDILKLNAASEDIKRRVAAIYFISNLS